MESGDGTEGVDDQDPLKLDESPQKTKKKSKEEIKAEKREIHREALEAFQQGLYPSVNSCAKAYNVDRKTLGRMITDNRDYIGGGRQSGIFTAEEESKLLGTDLSLTFPLFLIQLFIDVKIFGVVKSVLRTLIHRWHSNNPGGKLSKTTVISEIARPVFESALSWLPLKLADVGTEMEAFDFVLQERTPANVPKSLRELRGSILSQRNTNRYSERGLRPRRRKTRKRKQL